MTQLLMTIFGWLLLVAGGLGLILLIPLGIWLVVDAFLIPGWVHAHNNFLAHQLGA